MSKNTLQDKDNNHSLLNLDTSISDVLTQLSSQADKFEIDRNKGRAVGQFIRDDGIVRVEVQDYTGSRDAKVSFTSNALSKEELEYSVIERLRHGDKQSDIACAVGKSQAWVSSIKKKHGI